MKLDSNIQIKDTNGAFQLVNLAPSKITEIWDTLVPVIEETYATELEIVDGDVLHNIYMSILSGFMKAYLFMHGDVPIVFMLANVVREPWGLNTFFIFALYSFKPVTLALWYELFQVLREYTKELSCVYISAKTPNKRLIKLVDSLGGDTEYRYITLEV